MRTAILLVNLGSPDEPTEQSIAAYLREFLSDQRVVDLPLWLWQPILRGIILRRRPAQLVPKYRMIWRSDGAPLKSITAEQARALGERLRQDNVDVYWAMRYQNPSIRDVLIKMHSDGIQRIILLPMYPQFSHTTTSTVIDEVKHVLSVLSMPIELQTVEAYYDQDSYIGALKHSVLKYWEQFGRPDFEQGDQLILSFHGLPERNIQRGDPYQKQCECTARLLRIALGLTQDQVKISYQSRFGAQKWLQPSTLATIEQIATQGIGRVDVLCPGFAADCLETLEEVAIELKKTFKQAGGTSYHYIPCLNADSVHIEMMQNLIEQYWS